MDLNTQSSVDKTQVKHMRVITGGEEEHRRAKMDKLQVGKTKQN